MSVTMGLNVFPSTEKKPKGETKKGEGHIKDKNVDIQKGIHTFEGNVKHQNESQKKWWGSL